jgi:hypothetical protein
MSRRTCSTSRLEWKAIVASSHDRIRSASSAWIWMSEACA